MYQYYYHPHHENILLKDLLQETISSGIVESGKVSSDIYKCVPNNDDDAANGGQSRLTIYTNSNSVNYCGTETVTYNIGSMYSQIDCSKQRILSTATIVCLTFFIPLIFYLICWVIIVKVMKRGDLCIKAMCLQPQKKDDGGLASQENRGQTDVESINRLD